MTPNDLHYQALLLAFLDEMTGAREQVIALNASWNELWTDPTANSDDLSVVGELIQQLAERFGVEEEEQ